MQTFSRSLALLKSAVDDGICPGASAAIGVGKETLASTFLGNACIVDHTVPITAGTLYDMASLTKILSATMVTFRLLEEGKLRLYDRVGDFFPESGDKSSITLLQLMTHTSGLPAHIMLSECCDSPDDAPAAILEAPLQSSPGTKVRYSCMGYILLGRILELAGGEPLDRLADRLVFHPLSMTHTGYRPDCTDIAYTEMIPGAGCLKGVVHDENARFLGGISGNAGVFSDLEDCCRFASMLACHGQTPDGPFLSPAMLRAATFNYTPGQEENRGLGFLLTGSGGFSGDLFPASSFGHTGFTGTSLLIEPESGLWVVLLTNRVHPSRDNTRLIRFRSLFHNSVMAEFSRLQ